MEETAPVSTQGKTQLTRFLVVGLCAVAIDFLSYSVLVSFIAHAPAKAISFVLGTIIAYFFNKYWTFEQVRYSHSELIRFIILYTVTLGANVLVNHVALYFFPTFLLLAFLAATGTSTILNFIGQKWWVFTSVLNKTPRSISFPLSYLFTPALFLIFWQFIATIFTITTITFDRSVIVSAVLAVTLGTFVSRQISKNITVSIKTLIYSIIAICISTFLFVLRLNWQIFDYICPTGLVGIVTQISQGQFPAHYLSFPEFAMNYHQGTLFLAGSLSHLTNLAPGLAIQATFTTIYFVLLCVTTIIFITWGNRFYLLVPIFFTVLTSLSPKFYLNLDLNFYNYISILEQSGSNTWPLALTVIVLSIFTMQSTLNWNKKYTIVAILLLLTSTINATVFSLGLIVLGITTLYIFYIERKSLFFFLLTFLSIFGIYMVPQFIPSAFLTGDMYASPEYGIRILESEILKYFKQMTRFLMLCGPVIAAVFYISWLTLKQKISPFTLFIHLWFYTSLVFPFIFIFTNIDMWDNLHKFAVLVLFTSIIIVIHYLGSTQNTKIVSFILIFACIASLPATVDTFLNRTSLNFSHYVAPNKNINDVVSYLQNTDFIIQPYKNDIVGLCVPDNYAAIAEQAGKNMNDAYFTNFLLAESVEWEYETTRDLRNQLSLLELIKYVQGENTVVLVDKKKYSSEIIALQNSLPANIYLREFNNFIIYEHIK